MYQQAYTQRLVDIEVKSILDFMFLLDIFLLIRKALTIDYNTLINLKNNNIITTKFLFCKLISNFHRLVCYRNHYFARTEKVEARVQLPACTRHDL